MKINRWSPRYAILGVTFKCNCKCLTCDIWKKQNEIKEIFPNKYILLPKSLKSINITGGEPFLRDDLVEIIYNIKKNFPYIHLSFSSNGTPASLKNKSKEIFCIYPNATFCISIDGIGLQHDIYRGLEGSFTKALNTIEYLKTVGFKDLTISFTLGNHNLDQVYLVYDLTRKLKIHFSITLVASSPLYYGKNEKFSLPIGASKGEINCIFNKIIKRNNLYNLGLAYFILGLEKYLMNGKRLLSCRAGRDFFYMDPEGNIFPCVMKNIILGYIKDIENNDKILIDKLKYFYPEKCNDCWMTCSVIESVRKNKIKVSLSILKSKLKSLIYLS